VDRALILETTFLIDLEREHNRGVAGRAVQFLEEHESVRLYLPFAVAGELAAGFPPRDRTRWDAFIAPFYMLAWTSEVCWQYGLAYRHLQKNGQLIGSNDLWIAATALAYAMPVVTRDVEHYRRVPGLDVEAY
jgi:predicted nucleic acid-binding protein